MIRITIIVDNSAHQPDVQTEHGSACWIETGGHKLLFDTGAGQVLRTNAAVLGVRLDEAEGIVLSHGHYDHTGGLSEAWTDPDKTLLYLDAGALVDRYRISPTSVKAIGMPRAVRELAARHMASLRYTSIPKEIVTGMWLTGCVPRRHPEENAEPEPFFLDPDGQQPDPVVDDQSLYLVTGFGTVVVLGCAHAGVINTLDYIRDLTGGAPLRAVIGGMHLRSVSPTKLAWTVTQLQRLNSVLLAPAHCTGGPATAALSAAFASQCRPAGAGDTFDFSD